MKKDRPYYLSCFFINFAFIIMLPFDGRMNYTVLLPRILSLTLGLAVIAD